MARIAGLDVHSKWCVAVVQEEDGKVVGQETVETTAEALKKFVEKYELKGCRVGLESGAVSFFVAKKLAEAGAKPIIIDAAEVRRKARSKRQKSDTRDAFEICDGLRRDYFVSIVVVPDALCQEIRDTLTARRHFVRVRTQEVNAIKGILRKEGLAKKCTKAGGIKKLMERQDIEDSVKRAMSRHAAVWHAANEQIRELDDKLEQLDKQCGEQTKRLQKIPGVGRLVALAAYAYIGDPDRFASAKRVGSFGGMVAETDNSGDRERYGHITKRGPRELRLLLVQAAHHARRKSHPFHSHYVRIAKRSKGASKIAVIAVAHRLLRVMWAMLRDRSEFKAPERLGKQWSELMDHHAA